MTETGLDQVLIEVTEEETTVTGEEEVIMIMTGTMIEAEGLDHPEEGISGTEIHQDNGLHCGVDLAPQYIRETLP